MRRIVAGVALGVSVPLVLNLGITSTTLQANSKAECVGGAPQLSGSSVVENLVINAILDAPGAVITTSTRPDNLTATMLARSRRGPVAVFDPQHLAACMGTKEFVALLPQLLHLRNPDRDTILYPAISYPSYEMGAILAGCRPVPVAARADGRPG